MVWSGQRMVSITKVNDVHLTITKERIYGWVYGINFNSEISFNENGNPHYNGKDELKSKWYIKKLIYNIITQFRYYPDLLSDTSITITDETIRINKGKIMCVTYRHFHKLAHIRYLDEVYGKDENVLGVFIEITSNRIVTTRIIYKNKKQSLIIEDYDEYRTALTPYQTVTRKEV